MAFVFGDVLQTLGEAVGLTEPRLSEEDETPTTVPEDFDSFKWGGSYIHSRSCKVSDYSHEQLLARANWANKQSPKKCGKTVPGSPATVASDGTNIPVRQRGYATKKQKAPSLHSIYTLVGAKMVRSNSTVGKMRQVSKSPLFREMVREWTASLEAGEPTDTLETAIDTIPLSSTGESVSAETVAAAAPDTAEDERLKGAAQAFAELREKEKQAETERLLRLRAKGKKAAANRKLSALPTYLVWNMIFPAKAPDTGIFGGIFGGTTCQEDDPGQNLILLFRLTQDCDGAFLNHLKQQKGQRGAEKTVGKAAVKQDNLSALRLWARFIEATTPGSLDPLSQRFKIMLRIMPKVFVDSGVTWLSGFNGRPKILRESVEFSYHESDDSGELTRLLKALSAKLEAKTSAASAGKDRDAPLTSDKSAEAVATSTRNGSNATAATDMHLSMATLTKPTIAAGEKSVAKSSIGRGTNALASAATKTTDEARNCDIFEVTTDYMGWVKPYGLPIRVGWAIKDYLKDTILSFAFTIEGEGDPELPERVVASFDLVKCDYNLTPVDYNEYMGIRNK